MIGESDDKQWLTYWILFSIITLADATIGFALEFIPFYHILKLALFVALFHPQLKGAEKLYDQVFAYCNHFSLSIPFI